MMFRPLPTAALALVLAGLAACTRPTTKAPDYDLSLDMKELMSHVVDPGAWAFWHASGEIITVQGTESLAPKTDAAWEAAESGAAQVAEAGNLLLIPGYARDTTDWPRFAHQLVKAGLDGKAAAEAHDPQRMFTTGAAIYQVCTSCHAKYVIPGALAQELEREKTTPARLISWPEDVKRMQRAYERQAQPPPNRPDPSNPDDRVGAK